MVALGLQAAQDGELVGDLGLERHQLADVHARHVGLDRLELAAILDRRVGLQVVHVDVAGPAGQVDHDDRFVGGLGADGPLGLEAEQVGQGQAAEAQRPDAKEIAAGNAVAGPAGVSLSDDRVSMGSSFSGERGFSAGWGSDWQSRPGCVLIFAAARAVVNPINEIPFPNIGQMPLPGTMPLMAGPGLPSNEPGGSAGECRLLGR